METQIIAGHGVSDYSHRNQQVLRTLSLFKMGEQQSREKISAKMVSLIRQQDIPLDKRTILLAPPTRRNLARPVIMLAEFLAQSLGIDKLPDEQVDSVRCFGETPYSALSSGQERIAQTTRNVSIKPDIITNKQYVLIFDDTCASGKTLLEYKKAVLEAMNRAEKRPELVLSLVYVRFQTNDYSIEDVINQYLFWNVGKAAETLNAVGFLTTTSARVLRNLGETIFHSLYHKLSTQMQGLLIDHLEPFWQAEKFTSKKIIINSSQPIHLQWNAHTTNLYKPGE